MLSGAGSEVKKRCLAAVGIAYKSHIDGVCDFGGFPPARFTQALPALGLRGEAVEFLAVFAGCGFGINRCVFILRYFQRHHLNH